MLQISQQVCDNLLSPLTSIRASDSYTGSTIFGMNQYAGLCIFLVSNQVTFPSKDSDVNAYIDSALNAAEVPGNINNLLGIIPVPKNTGGILNTTFVFNGTFQFTARRSGTIGGAIVTKCPFPNPSTVLPFTSTTPDTFQYGYKNIHNWAGKYSSVFHYLLVTDSIGISTSTNSVVRVSNLTLVQDSTYTVTDVNLTFKTKGI